MKRIPPFRNRRDVFYLVHEEPTKYSKNGIYIVKPKDNSYRAIWAVVWDVPIKLMSTKEIDSINSTKADREELANVVSGLVPMGSVANLTELEAKPKRNNDAYYVEDQLSPEGNPYIYRWDAGLNLWVNTKQVVFKDVITQGLGDSSNKAMSQKAVTDELALKIDKTSVKQVTGESTVDVMSQKAVTDEIAQTDLNSKLSGVKITNGNNLLNRNYVEPSNPYEYERGGANRLIHPTTGIVVDYTGWYISPLIDWQTNSQAIVYNCRCWAQYAEDGVTLKEIYYPENALSGNILINRASGAKFIRVGLDKSAVNYMMNYGSTLLPYEPFKEIVQSRAYGGTPLYFQADVDEIASFKEMLLSESYIPQSPTYTDGVVNSPINVIWADGDTGVLTLTRNTDGLVTKIVATKIRSGVTTTLTENITRDADGNVTLISIA